MTYADVSISARIADVQARIATLHDRFTAMAPVATGAATTQFSNVLSDAMSGGASSGSTAVASPPVVAPAPQAGAVAPPPAAPGSGSAGQRAVALAKQHLGTPYVWGGQTPGVGFDCSGLVQHTFKQLGVNLPRVSRDQARAGQAVASLADARPGDLVAFGSPVNHIGIYAGDNKMVVAPRRGDVVKVQQIYRTPTAIRRVL